MTTYTILRPDDDPLHVEADGYSRGTDRQLFLYNDTADGPIADFPPETAIVENARLVG